MLLPRCRFDRRTGRDGGLARSQLAVGVQPTLLFWGWDGDRGRMAEALSNNPPDQYFSLQHAAIV
jgi:hypothetical protein